MAITLRNAIGTSFASNTTFVCNLPVGTAANDTMVFLGSTSVGGGSAHVPNTPAGWTLLASASGFLIGSQPSAAFLLGRRAAGAEASVTVTIDQAQLFNYSCAGFIGVDASTPFERWALAQVASAASANCPSVSTLTNNAAVVPMTINDDNGANAISAIPSGTTVTQNTLDAGANDQNCQSWKVQAVAGTTGVLTWTYGVRTPLGTIVTGVVTLRESGAKPVPGGGGNGSTIAQAIAQGFVAQMINQGHGPKVVPPGQKPPPVRVPPRPRYGTDLPPLKE